MVAVDVVRNITPLCTIGPVWKSARSPIWKAQTGVRREAFSAVISLSGEWRVPA